MSKIDKILSEVYKNEVNLESQEVQLKGIKDLEKYLKNIFDTQKKLDKTIPAIEKLQSDIKQQKSTLEMFIKEAENGLKEFGAKTKELGLAPDGVSQYKSLLNEISISKSEYLKSK